MLRSRSDSMGETLGVLFADSGANAHPDWRGDVDAVFRPAGLSAFRAQTSAEAIARVERGGLAGAVLIADRWRIDGLALLRIIRSIDAALPCWLVTDAPTRATLETALALRAYCVMKHPPTPVELALVVRRLMAN